MNQQPSIQTLEPEEYQVLDIDRLRQEGLRYIRELSGEVWTDHNLHDPGITTLELLAYALTDLSYRTNLDMRDIVARPPDSAPQTADFFTAGQILTNRPLTVKDYRKLLLDHGVTPEGDRWLRNAWAVPVPYSPYTPPSGQSNGDATLRNYNGLYDIILELEDENLNDGVIRIEVDTDDGPLAIAVDLPADWDRTFVKTGRITSFFANDLQISGGKGIVPFNYKSPDGKTQRFSLGLRTGKALEQESIEDLLRKTGVNSVLKQVQTILPEYLNTREEIIVEVQRLLAANRNLCEDFLTPVIVKRNEVILHADIDIPRETNVEELLAEIFFRVDRVLSPPVRFYSPAELIEKGQPVEEVFEGPPLRHGFIDNAELTDIEEGDILYATELLQAILRINRSTPKRAILGVRGMKLSNDRDGQQDTPEPADRLPLVEINKYRPRVSIDQSIDHLRLFLNGDANEMVDNQTIDWAKVKERFDEKRETDRVVSDSTDVDLTPGNTRHLDRYHSVQRLFPLLYGIGAEGLPSTAGHERRAQNRQFKAFLLFFEQLLADYLVQLNHVKDLLSIGVRPDRSYFRQALADVPGVDELVGDGYDHFLEEKEAPRQDGQLNLDEDRRSRLLDHLLARFSEQFVDFALYKYLLRPENVQVHLPVAPEAYLNQKRSYLRQLAGFGPERGKGFNYLERKDGAGGFGIVKLLITPNQSGLEQKLRVVLNIDPKLRESVYIIEHLLLRPRAPGAGNVTIDKYSFEISVIFSYSKSDSRFKRPDFQQFVLENLLQMETPVHIHFANVLWIPASHTRWGAFTKAYDSWKIAMAKIPPDPKELDKTSEALEKTIGELKSSW